MDARYIKFYSSLMKKTNSTMGESISKYDFLKEVCNFFDFGNGFVYLTNPKKIFYRSDYYHLYEDESFSNEIDFVSVLGPEMYSELTNSSILLYHSHDEEKSELQITIAELFNAGSYVLVPVKNLKGELAGIVGLSDRRAENRRGEVELENCLSVLSLLVNIIKLEVYETGIHNAEEILKRILDHTGIDIYVNDFNTHEILYVNKSMAAPYGGVENMMGKKCYSSIFEGKTQECDFCPQKKLIDEEGNPTKIYSWDYERAMDGSWFRVLSSAFPWLDGRLAHLVASVDITENKRNELLVQKLANRDQLTGLANRRKLLKDIDSFIKDETLFGKEWCMLFCDLDGFKEINDTLGHAAGDALLKEISVRLGKKAKVPCKTYRNGGDEFVILLACSKIDMDMFESIDSIMKDFTDPCTYEGKQISCGCSIGAVHYPIGGTSSNELLHNADVAMYEAKNAGKGVVRYFGKEKVRSREELEAYIMQKAKG